MSSQTPEANAPALPPVLQVRRAPPTWPTVPPPNSCHVTSIALDAVARAGSRGTDARPPAWLLAMLVLAVAPLFVAVGMQAHRGWRPVSDDADVAILAHDV